MSSTRGRARSRSQSVSRRRVSAASVSTSSSEAPVSPPLSPLSSAAPIPLVVRTLSELRDDGIPKFVDRPHSILVMLAGLAVFAASAFYLNNGTPGNIKVGLMGVTGGMLIFAALHFRDSYLWRPHPSVWRIVLGISFLYALLLSFILQQDKNDVREWLKFIDPKLGVKLPDRSYAEECALLTPGHPGGPMANLLGALKDEFVIAHFLGWYGKALLLRDTSLLWLLSITFELIELTFEFMFPNFAECWWDHIVLDILVCNGLGIYLGMLTCQYLEKREIRRNKAISDSLSIIKSEPKSIGWKLKRAAVQFTPAEWTSYRWEPTKNLRRFLWVVNLLVFFNIADMNSFFLKYLLWIPPPHPINAIRLLIWLFMSIPAIREYYQLVTDAKCWRLGTQGWVSLSILFQEMLIIAKFSQNEFPNNVPSFTVWFWSVFVIAVVFWMIWNFGLRKHKTTKKN